MVTVNSLSGGKTSSYIAAHYPADYDVFAIVCIADHNAGRKIDKKLKQVVNDKLQKYCGHQPEFKATSEDPQIIKTMLDLEQYIGREIIWLRGDDWETMLRIKKAIPNRSKRFCTTILKIQPIFEFLFKYTELPVEMRIGYRYDELERKDSFTDTFKFASHSEFQPNSARWITRWEEMVWRVGRFPLIEDKIFHHSIQQYWKGKNIVFPEDSNCQNCFWKQPQQLRKNFESNEEIMLWSMIWEDLLHYTFRDDLSLRQIKTLGIQTDFAFGTGSGCQAGFCTD